jgi:D-alanyl-D-alanine carboxypeptidase (penicillin-binding protein 5/6)
VGLGTEHSVPLVAGKDLIVTMPRNWRQKASVKISYDTPLKAPIAKGDMLGKLEVTGQGVPNFSVPLLAVDDVPRLGLPGRAMAVLSKYVTGT